MVALLREVVFHEGVLAGEFIATTVLVGWLVGKGRGGGRGDRPAAVPEVEGEIAKEAHVRVLDVDGGPETTRIFGDVVTEDDRPHGRLAGAGFALGMSCQRCSREPVRQDTYHEEHLLLSALSFLHRDGGWRCSLLPVGVVGEGRGAAVGCSRGWGAGGLGETGDTRLATSRASRLRQSLRDTRYHSLPGYNRRGRWPNWEKAFREGGFQVQVAVDPK